MLHFTCLGLLATALSAGATPTAKDPLSTASLTWTACPSPFPDNFQCSKLQVPLHYDHPAGKHIPLNVVKIPAKVPSKRAGSWIFQEGGPGFPTSNDTIALDNAIGWKRLQQEYDIVTMDPRGVGINYPIRCDPKLANQLLTLNHPRTEHDWQQQRDLSGKAGDDCKKRTLEALGFDIWPTVDTLTSAKDLESLRVALNEGGINYYGLSWGSYATWHNKGKANIGTGSQRGQQYAQLYPHNIRTMILDAVVDHTIPLELTSVSEAVGFGRAADYFYQWASTNQTSALYGKDAGTLFKELLSQIDKAPIQRPACAESGICYPSITKPLMVSKFTTELDHETYFPDLARGIARALQGNFTGWDTAVLTEDTGLSFSYTQGCQDFFTNETYDQWASRNRAEIALVGTDYNGPTMAAARFLQCPQWPAAVVNPPKPLNIANTSAPILLVNALWDPATPYDGAVNIQRQIGGSVLLTRRGEGHGSMYVGRNGEAQDIMIDYILTGKPPAPGTVVDS